MVKPIILSKADKANFRGLVIKSGPNDCWLWDGYHDRDGYGVFRPHYKRYRAHRVACFLAYGDAGSMTCHKCGNTGCVNPKHLYPGNGNSNAKDMVRDGHSLKGEKHHNTNLLNAQVKRIARLTQAGLQPTEIAGVIGCALSQVYHIVNGETWSWLTGFKPGGGMRRGEQNPAATITNVQVKLIAKMCKRGIPDKDIANKLNINTRLIARIRRGDRWAWLTGILKK